MQSEIMSYLHLVYLAVFVLPRAAKVTQTWLGRYPFDDGAAIDWSHYIATSVSSWRNWSLTVVILRER